MYNALTLDDFGEADFKASRLYITVATASSEVRTV